MGNIKISHYWPFVRRLPFTGQFPSQRASNTENLPVVWRHRGKLGQYYGCWCPGSLCSQSISDISRFHVNFLYKRQSSSWWRHQMETFPRYWPIVRGIHRSPVNSPHKGQWHGAWVFSLICAWSIGWVNNRDAGDLGHHRPHYDFTANLRKDVTYTSQAETQTPTNTEHIA